MDDGLVQWGYVFLALTQPYGLELRRYKNAMPLIWWNLKSYSRVYIVPGEIEFYISWSRVYYHII